MNQTLDQLQKDTPKEIARRAVHVGIGTETRPGNCRFRYPIFLCGIKVGSVIAAESDDEKVDAAERDLIEAVTRLLEDPTRKVW
jgi:hypothetical protein